MESHGSDCGTAHSHPTTPVPPANVLVLGPSMEGAVDERCSDLLSGGDGTSRKVLIVSVLQSPDQRIDVLRRRTGELPDTVAVIGVGDATRSAGGLASDGGPRASPGAGPGPGPGSGSGSGSGPGPTPGPGSGHGSDLGGRSDAMDGLEGAVSVNGPGSTVLTDVVSDPGDLTGIGIKVGQVLSAWSGDGTDVRACFHSLTALLQYADLQRTFRFLHVLTRRVEAVNGIAHFHLDPAAVDDRTLATVRSLFDCVIQYEDGIWTD